MSKILVIGDIHEPACHVGYRKFCQDLYDAWGCNRVVFIGDITDCAFCSFWDPDIDHDGINAQIDKSRAGVAKWVKAFPKADVMIGNHDIRPELAAAKAKIPKKFLVASEILWDTPRWKWVDDIKLDGVHYLHGHRYTRGGMQPALLSAKDSATSTVIGHYHTKAGVNWARTKYHKQIFGMDVGCGVDVDNPLLNYLKKSGVWQPILSAGVVMDGVPYHEIMPMARGEKYHKSKFKHKARI